jgi:hypothetical protein
MIQGLVSQVQQWAIAFEEQACLNEVLDEEFN